MIRIKEETDDTVEFEITLIADIVGLIFSVGYFEMLGLRVVDEQTIVYADDSDDDEENKEVGQQNKAKGDWEKENMFGGGSGKKKTNKKKKRETGGKTELTFPYRYIDMFINNARNFFSFNVSNKSDLQDNKSKTSDLQDNKSKTSDLQDNKSKTSDLQDNTSQKNPSNIFSQMFAPAKTLEMKTENIHVESKPQENNAVSDNMQFHDSQNKMNTNTTMQENKTIDETFKEPLKSSTQQNESYAEETGKTNSNSLQPSVTNKNETVPVTNENETTEQKSNTFFDSVKTILGVDSKTKNANISPNESHYRRAIIKLYKSGPVKTSSQYEEERKADSKNIEIIEVSPEDGRTELQREKEAKDIEIQKENKERILSTLSQDEKYQMKLKYDAIVEKGELVYYMYANEESEEMKEPTKIDFSLHL
jgi:hypothetical protein